MIRTSVICGLLLIPWVNGGPAFADPLPPVAIWPDGAPGEIGDIAPEGELPLKPNDTTIRIENVSRPTISVYLPPKEKHTGTAVVICPGGGYNILAWNKEGTEVAEWLNTLGVTGIVLKYRVPVRKNRDRYAAPFEDVQRAIGLVRQRAQDWNLDPQRIGLLGFSAGGHLAAAVSTNFEQRAYKPLDAADQQSSRPDFTLLIYPAYLVDQDNRLSPELKVSAETPRTFLAMTADDGVRVEGALFYYLALKEAKVPAEMHIYPTGGHGYGLRPSTHLVSTWPARAADWLKASGLLTRSEPRP